LLEIKDENELKKLLASNKKLLALFFASWCPYSRSFRPIFESEAAGMKDCGTVVAVVDEDENPLWDVCGVERVPTVVYFKNGKVFKKLVETPGVGLNRKELQEFLKKL
jgi:thioredoxin-like negative regulator of GroEL